MTRADQPNTTGETKPAAHGFNQLSRSLDVQPFARLLLFAYGIQPPDCHKRRHPRRWASVARIAGAGAPARAKYLPGPRRHELGHFCQSCERRRWSAGPDRTPRRRGGGVERLPSPSHQRQTPKNTPRCPLSVKETETENVEADLFRD